MSPIRVLFLLCLAVVLASCQSVAEKVSPTHEPPTAVGAPFSLTVDAAGVLYTWVKGDGSFQLAERLEEIPAESRRQVRVVVDGQPPGTPTHVFVANLEHAQSGGRVPLSLFERSSWEARGAKQRQDKVAPLEAAEQAATAPAAVRSGLGAIVYGADWCKPCHQAEDYLKQKGLKVVKKDIEEDPRAASELRAKMERAGLGTSSSIPILEVAGTMLVGFSPRAIDAALRAAKR